MSRAPGSLRLAPTGTQSELVARRLATDMLAVGRRAANEEDLRIGVEKLLEPALEQLAIDSIPRYERSYRTSGSVFRGRSDAVYGQVVIEYEHPRAFRTRKGIDHAAQQLDDYLRAEVGRKPEGLAALSELAAMVNKSSSSGIAPPV